MKWLHELVMGFFTLNFLFTVIFYMILELIESNLGYDTSSFWVFVCDILMMSFFSNLIDPWFPAKKEIKESS